MLIPNRLVFKLVKYDVDYIQFRVSYQLAEDQWITHGVAWQKADNTIAYYISRLNSSFDLSNDVALLYQQKAYLIENDYSLKFSNQLLEDFTLENIRQCLAKRKRSKHFSK